MAKFLKMCFCCVPGTIASSVLRSTARFSACSIEMLAIGLDRNEATVTIHCVLP